MISLISISKCFKMEQNKSQRGQCVNDKKHDNGHLHCYLPLCWIGSGINIKHQKKSELIE